MSPERKHVDHHITKTGGTSVEALLREIYGSHELLIYNPQQDALIRASDIDISRANPAINLVRYILGYTPLLPLVLRVYYQWRAKKRASGKEDGKWFEPENLPPDFRAIHGHFKANRFPQLKSPFTSVVMRKPIERALSHFAHFQRNHGQALWGQTIPWRRGMTFEDFAKIEDNQNYQAKLLAGQTLSSFDLVGVTEALASFSEKMVGMLWEERLIETKPIGIKISRLNRSPRRIMAEEVDPKIVEWFKEFNARDYDLYDEALTIAQGYAQEQIASPALQPAG